VLIKLIGEESVDDFATKAEIVDVIEVMVDVAPVVTYP
jgi:hypothetical protein